MQTFFSGIAIVMLFSIPFILIYAIAFELTDDGFTKWANERDKFCWEKSGDFKISKYGVRCIKNGAVQIIFNETFRPTDDRNKKEIVH